jgi:hypothetical protein
VASVRATSTDSSRINLEKGTEWYIGPTSLPGIPVTTEGTKYSPPTEPVGIVRCAR